MSQTTQIIRDHNDRFRRGDPTIPGHMLMTSALAAHAANAGIDASAIVAQVQYFEDFSSDNDPYQQADVGSFKVAGETCFWKMDGVDAPSHSGIAMCQTGFVRSQFN